MFMQESEKVVSISSDHLEPVTPTKNNKVTSLTLAGKKPAQEQRLTRFPPVPGQGDHGGGPGGHRDPPEHRRR